MAHMSKVYDKAPIAHSGKSVTSADDSTALHFGSYHLEGTKRLWRGDRLVEVRPRPLTVLRYLAERQGQLVTGEELLKQLWPGIYVTKTVLRVCVRELRQALDEDPVFPRIIETVGHPVYRFIAPISTTAPPVIINQGSVVGSDKEKTKASQLRIRPQQITPDDRQLTTPFVSREPELARLHECFARAQHGECQ